MEQLRTHIQNLVWPLSIGGDVSMETANLDFSAEGEDPIKTLYLMHPCC